MTTKNTANNRLLELDKKYYLPVFKRQPLAIKQGKGVYVTDFTGKKYLDSFAGIAVNILGHSHPKLLAAIEKQMTKIIHTSNYYVNESQVLLAEKLCKLSGLNRAFFCNSGAEAVEAAFKIARKYAHSKGKGGNIISFDNCFHGRTLATIASGKKKYQEGFEPIPEGFIKSALNDTRQVEVKINKDTAAVIIELIQGEGGLHVVDKNFLMDVRKQCDQHDALLIFDEIQTGMGRTGKFFAFEHYGVKPDIITMAKGLAGGLPIGAVLCKQKVADTMEYGSHGSTFGGNALVTAAALATIDIIEKDKILKKVEETSKIAFDKLKSIAKEETHIREVRGKGLMIGIELTFDGQEVVNKMLKRGVLANCTADRVIRLVPPLIITKSEMMTIIKAFYDSLKEVKKHDKN